jgi:hypothetical protein
MPIKQFKLDLFPSPFTSSISEFIFNKILFLIDKYMGYDALINTVE